MSFFFSKQTVTFLAQNIFKLLFKLYVNFLHHETRSSLFRGAGGPPASSGRDERQGRRGAEHVLEVDEGEDDQCHQGHEGSQHGDDRQPHVVPVVLQETERLDRHGLCQGEERSGEGPAHS